MNPKITILFILLAALAASACGTTCRPQASTSCTDGVVFWLDSCGDRQEAKEVCGCGCNVVATACEDCICTPDCVGKECGPDGCDGFCFPGCDAGQACNAAGQCEVCTPNCIGKECGSDSCGGECSPGCIPGEVCNVLGQCGSCTPNCQGKECGSDGCGGQCAPGCSAGEACDALGRCQACTPDCLGRVCGDDGCGGQCAPGCSAGEACNLLGQCESCTSDCQGRVCGDDGCGGECTPGCGPGEVCTGQGQCVACTPDCLGKECGPDGCGGQCTPGCSASETCNAQGQCETCVPDCLGRECGPDGCGDQCSPGCSADETCDAQGQCVSCSPVCQGKECGPDGCGGQCAPGCQPDEACSPAGSCETVACGGAQTTITGDLITDVSAVQFDTASVALQHKRDVDPWEGGCITSIAIDLALAGGCNLHLDAGGLYTPTGGIQIQQITFSADSFCPNFSDTDEGTYGGLGGLIVAEVVPGVAEVPGHNEAESCVATTMTVLLEGDLTRAGDNETLTVSPTQIVISGDFTSLGDPAVTCPCLPQCQGRDCGDDGCGGVCGTCEQDERCTLAGLCQSATATTCWTGSDFRDKVTLAEGDLVVTEVMANPAAVPDADGEWFEVVVTRDVDVNGLEWGPHPSSVSLAIPEGDCLTMPTGTRLVMARDPDPAVNGGIQQVDIPFAFNLTNSDGGVHLGFYGQTVDTVTWVSAQAGVATNLDPNATTSTDNDIPSYWCPAEDPYGAGDLGTPGAANVSCGLPVNQCEDGGVPRNKVPPVLGDLVITEYMPNPNFVSDADGEWFEVLVSRDVDLNGLQIGRDTPSTEVFPEGPCVRVTAGSLLLFAKDADPITNGGLPAVDGVFGFNLVNSNGQVSVGLYGTVLDHVAYTSSSAGVATSLDPDYFDALDNDDPANWCPAVDPYNAGGDTGTPGATNPQCP